MGDDGDPVPEAFYGPFCPWIHAADDQLRPQPWSLRQRRLTHWLVVYSAGGSEELVVDGQAYHVAAGGAYLIQPGQLADLGSPTGSQPYWIHFDVRFDPRRRAHPFAQAYDADLTQRLAWMQPNARTLWGADVPVVVPAPLVPRFAAEIPAIIQRWRIGGRLAALDAALRLGSLVLALVEHVHDAPVVDPLERFARAEAIARNNLNTDFGLREFAAATGYGRSRFCALYRELRGCTPAAFLKAERLARAKTLLVRPDLPIATVGGLVGYPDATVFGRIFREDTGVSPGAWRDQRRPSA